MSNSLRPVDWSLPGSSLHWDSAGKNTEEHCCALLQGIFPTHKSNSHLSTSRELAGGFFTTSATWKARKGLCSRLYPIYIWGGLRVGDSTGQELRPQAQPCNCYPTGRPDPHQGRVLQPGSESTPQDSSLSTCIQNPRERKERGVSKMLHVSMCLELGQVLNLQEPRLSSLLVQQCYISGSLWGLEISPQLVQQHYISGSLWGLEISPQLVQ